MLSNVLTHVPWLAPAGLALLVICAPIAGLWLIPHRRVTVWLLVVALLAIAALTLTPQGFPSPSITCSWGWPFIDSTPEETIANIALYLPAGFLAVIFWRRYVLPLVGLSVLSAVIEAVQAVVPPIGRACDSRDWMTNTIGVLAGAALAALTLAWNKRRKSSAKQAFNKVDDQPTEMSR